jgi:hypothetical protein
MPITDEAAKGFAATGLLRKDPELVILDPTSHSRMRWLPSWK